MGCNRESEESLVEGKMVFIMTIYLDSMQFRVDMLLTIICLVHDSNTRYSFIPTANEIVGMSSVCDNSALATHSMSFATLCSVWCVFFCIRIIHSFTLLCSA